MAIQVAGYSWQRSAPDISSSARGAKRESDSAYSRAAVASGHSADLALQQWLGLLSKRWARAGAVNSLNFGGGEKAIDRSLLRVVQNLGVVSGRAVLRRLASPEEMDEGENKRQEQ
jgi:hypothetical protein